MVQNSLVPIIDWAVDGSDLTILVVDEGKDVPMELPASIQMAVKRSKQETDGRTRMLTCLSKSSAARYFQADLSLFFGYRCPMCVKMEELVEEQLQPTLDWLQQRLGLSVEKLEELVRRQPTILNLSIQDQLEPKLSWLQNRLHLEQGVSKGQ